MREAEWHLVTSGQSKAGSSLLIEADRLVMLFVQSRQMAREGVLDMARSQKILKDILGLPCFYACDLDGCLAAHMAISAWTFYLG